MDLARVGASRRRDAAHSEQPAVWAAQRRSAQRHALTKLDGLVWDSFGAEPTIE
jgi:hypothetical protein